MIICPSSRGVISGPADPFFSSVVFLCHFNSSSGAGPTTYVQSSPRGSAISSVGNTVVASSAQSKFGGFSLCYPPAVTVIKVQSVDTDYQMGSGDFTLEWWQYLATISALTEPFDLRDTANQVAPTVYCQATGVIKYFVSNTDRITSSANAVAVNTWQHIALTRSGTSTKLFVDGTQVGSTYTDSNNYNASSTMTIGNAHVGGVPVSSASNPGYIDEVRVTKGVARYASNFTPPSTPFPDH